MPDPIASSCFSPDPLCGLNDDEPLTCQSAPAAASTATLDACLPSASSAEPNASSAAASALVEKFLPNDGAAFVAASPAPSASPAPPGLLTVRPDQIDLQIGVPRIQGQATLGSVQLTAGVDVLNANAHLGSLNGDGSRGENIGAGANLLGGELNVGYKGWSLTVGVAASLGGSISSGEGRDIDGDGVRERCFAMSLGPFTLGECDEL
jgi:hypothetical protein